MSRPRRALLALVTASAVAGTARAQPAARDEATPPGADGPAPAEPRGAAPAEPTDGGAATPTPAAGDAATAPPVAPASDGEPGAEPASGLEAICDIAPDACPRLDLAAEAAKPLDEVIYSVQPLYALKKRRFQLLPYWSITLNDQFVQHPGPGLSVSYYLAEVVAVGATFNYYRAFNVDSAFNADVRRSVRVGVPLSEYDWGASLDLVYVMGHGKFAGFGDFIFTWDTFLVGGGGLLRTRPIAVIDPDNRAFSFTSKLAGHAGVGVRIFFTRWLAAALELRDYVFQDHLESLQTPIDPMAARDPETWYGEREIVNDVQAQFGVAVFVPFTFEYHLPP